ncbi:M20 family metallopeptidase [Leucobacter sp. M11]|uniref:M20 family metallopeptidase n=1 Tax=Leucobacter sp. M11 TaxID=2993565 RepID=UPI002D7FC758|nr:M20 family metallopeptidase [Leucobacter sp. M11]MEB4613173.1 M20 family metallopeptidase [Leucobacter sp. M11]
MNLAPEPIHQDSAELALLRELVSIESPSGDGAASARIADVVAERFRDLGGTVRRLDTESGTNLVIDFPGPGRPLLLVGHTDTVWPLGTLAGELPWAQDGDVLRGPGVYDMKSGIVVMHAALSRLGGAPARAVRILLVCDEEVGSPTSLELIRAEALGACAALGFESPHPDGALKIGRRGSTRLELRVTGRAAHAALDPELGISAIDELVDQLGRLRAITVDPDLPSPVLCNVGTVSGGTRANVVPESAQAEVGLRFLDGESEARVLGAIAQLTPIRAGALLEVRTLSSRPAWAASPADEALLADLASSAQRVGQGLSARPAAGAGDTNLIGSLGVPTADGFGPRGGGAHALSEHVLRSSLAERIALLTAVLSAPPAG